MTSLSLSQPEWIYRKCVAHSIYKPAKMIWGLPSLCLLLELAMYWGQATKSYTVYTWLSSSSWYPRNKTNSYLLTSCPQFYKSMEMTWKKYSICSLSSLWWKHSPFRCFHWTYTLLKMVFFLNLRWALVSDTGGSYTMIICFIPIKWNTSWKRSIRSLTLFHWWTIFQISLLTSERLISSEIFRP